MLRRYDDARDLRKGTERKRGNHNDTERERDRGVETW